MKPIARPVPSLLLIGAAALAAAGAFAAPPALQLPQESSRLRPSTLPGYMIATQKCAICHSVDYVSYQPPGMNQAQWTAEVAKMQHAYGAPIGDDEVRQIGAYLAVAYGSAKATDAGVIAASSETRSASVSAAGSAATGSADASIDVTALLNANACLSCHAIAQKIVGPSYRDVAAKYKGDAKAPTQLEASIRQGSVGRWGEAPMPPFAGLSEAQAKALAAFVLKQ